MIVLSHRKTSQSALSNSVIAHTAQIFTRLEYHASKESYHI